MAKAKGQSSRNLEMVGVRLERKMFPVMDPSAVILDFVEEVEDGDGWEFTVWVSNSVAQKFEVGRVYEFSDRPIPTPSSQDDGQ